MADLPQQPPPSDGSASTVTPTLPTINSGPRWQHKLIALLEVIFCFEMGLFLMVFPWASAWDLNYFSRLPLWAQDFWTSPYFRGAISGIGAVNIYISFLEILRLRRFSA